MNIEIRTLKATVQMGSHFTAENAENAEILKKKRDADSASNLKNTHLRGLCALCGANWRPPEILDTLNCEQTEQDFRTQIAQISQIKNLCSSVQSVSQFLIGLRRSIVRQLPQFAETASLCRFYLRRMGMRHLRLRKVSNWACFLGQAANVTPARRAEI